jgi:hypothetical protein
MAKPTKKSKFSDFLMRAFRAKDADEVEKIAEEAESMDEESEGDDKDKKDKKTEDGFKRVLDRLTAIDERLDKIEAKDEGGDDQDDDEDGDETMDTVIGAETAGKLSDAGVKLYTGDSAKNIPALAEILAPGTKIPTFDAKTTDAQRALSLCKCQRKALDAAYQTDAGREAITPFLGGHAANFGKLPLAVLNAAFIGAANVMRAKNNDGNHRVNLSTKDFGRQSSVSDINARNREFYKNR